MLAPIARIAGGDDVLPAVQSATGKRIEVIGVLRWITAVTTCGGIDGYQELGRYALVAVLANLLKHPRLA